MCLPLLTRAHCSIEGRAPHLLWHPCTRPSPSPLTSHARLARSLQAACTVPQVLDADRLAERGATDMQQVNAAARRNFDVRSFNAPVTSIALSPNGDYAAAASVAEGTIAFFRVISSSSEMALQLLALYPFREPRMLTWAPPEGQGRGAAAAG